MKPRPTPEERRERRRRAMHRSKFAVPSGITLLSVLCGFSSVVWSLNAAADHPEYSFRMAAFFLVLAGFFDGMDGRVARLTNTATEFGVHLDSLADVVSFGMAPAILAYRYGFFQLGAMDPQLRYVGWAASFFFIACGALRLARFNVQVGNVDPRFFVGMPIPMGAACIASVILCWPSSPKNAQQAYLFAFELFLVGALMVSTLRFPSFKKKPKGPKAMTTTLAAAALALSLLIMFRERFLVGLLATIVALSFLMNLGWKLGWKGVLPPRDGEEPIPHES